MTITAGNLNLIGSPNAQRAAAPCSIQCDWAVVNSDPMNADGAPVANPGVLVRAALVRLPIPGLVTAVELRLRYKTAVSISTSPIIQPFGFSSDLKTPQRLINQATSPTHQSTLTVDATNDEIDSSGTTSYSYTLSAIYDLRGNSYLLVPIRTALVGSGQETFAAIMAKWLN